MVIRRVVAGLAGGALLVAAAVVGVGGTSAVASSRGCPANASTVPAGSWTARIGDVDGDGRADTEFYTRDLRYGIRTASGAVHMQHDGLAGPGPHSGWSARLAGGPVITVLDDGRQAHLYSFTGCDIRPVKNAQGAQYSFWLAQWGPEPIRGTGVACTAAPRHLEGVLARQHADGRFTIETTRIAVSADGTRATNGSTGVGTHRYARGSSTVQHAWDSTCGSTPVVHTDGR